MGENSLGDGPPFEILLDEGACLVINKPPGILTQAPPGIESVETKLKSWLAMRESLAEPPYLATIHRIDRPASGALLFCRDKKAARNLSRQFEHRRVAKTYWTFVEGNVTPHEGTWQDQVYKIHGMAQAEVVPADHPGGKRALLHFNVLCTTERGSWLQIELETGRTHQIRVQTASRGHAVCGDLQYGASHEFGEATDDARARPIALHARSLAFTLPHTSHSVEIIADPPAVWQSLELPLDLF